MRRLNGKRAIARVLALARLEPARHVLCHIELVLDVRNLLDAFVELLRDGAPVALTGAPHAHTPQRRATPNAAQSGGSIELNVQLD